MPLTLKVRDVMEDNVIILDGNLPAKEALNKMLENNVWSVVISINDMPMGVVTERDLLRRVIAKGRNIDKVPLKDIMSSPLITIDSEASFAEAWKLMIEKGVRRLYVVEKGKIIGRVTQTGLFTKLLDAVLALSSIRYTI
jgi:signal-transduction protein with cAMP-binding, CBS, and nucleotidyltransferase domain